MESIEIGGVLHVSKTMVVILEMRMSSELHAICHCSTVKWLLFFSSCVSSSIWFELLSKNFIWNFSRFSFGMGLRILGGGIGVVIDVLAISVFDGICSCIRRWSEFMWMFWFVVDVHWSLLGVCI